MMKKLIVLALLLAVAGSAQSATIGVWKTNTTGLWSTGANWATPAGSVPPAGTAGDEIKIQQTNSDVTLDTGLADNRITSGNAAGTVALRVGAGNSFSVGEFRVGAKVNSTTGGTSTVTQTGGTLTVGDLILGRGAGTNIDTVVGNGTYTISGGTLAVTGTTNYASGRIYVGAGLNMAVGSAVSGIVGKFTVDGAGATSITAKKLYVGGDNVSRFGTGTVEFKISDAGVNKIQVTDVGGTILDAGGTGIANLLVSFTGSVIPAGNIVLVENTNTGAVSGIFDTLNGGSAVEGTTVVLGGNTYKLTYVYAAGVDAVANDIALVTPEPATLAILGLGGLLLRRRLA